MKTTATRTVFVNQIDAEPRRSLEQLVGQPLADDEKVRIIVTKPRVSPDAVTKATALEDMRRVLTKTQTSSASDADVGAAVDEAMDAIRYRRES